MTQFYRPLFDSGSRVVNGLNGRPAVVKRSWVACIERRGPRDGVYERHAIICYDDGTEARVKEADLRPEEVAL